MRRVIDERAAWADFADVPGGTTGLLVKDYKGKEADQLVYKVDTGLLGELRGHERQAAAELEQWKAGVEECEVIGATPPAIKPAARHGEAAPSTPCQCRARRRATAVGWRDGVEWDPSRAVLFPSSASYGSNPDTCTTDPGGSRSGWPAESALHGP
jgi:hypothetical protein